LVSRYCNTHFKIVHVMTTWRSCKVSKSQPDQKIFLIISKCLALVLNFESNLLSNMSLTARTNSAGPLKDVLGLNTPLIGAQRVCGKNINLRGAGDGAITPALVTWGCAT
jgi:hypothetical protein